MQLVLIMDCAYTNCLSQSKLSIPVRLFLALFLLLTAAFAAELPAIPAQPIARKKELLFSDDFAGAELGEGLGHRGADFFR